MGRGINLGWMDDEIGRLRTLHAKGISASLIGAEMNRTRNAVLGKLWRLGLSNAASIIRKRCGIPPQPQTIPKKSSVRQRAYSQRKRIERQKVLEELRCAPVTPGSISFADLQDNECRYPEGEGPYTFCGHQQEAGSSYCYAHAALTHRNGQRMSPDEYREHRLRIVLQARKQKCIEVEPQISEAAE